MCIRDSDLNRDMLSRRLARRGHSIVLACDGPEGLTKAYTCLLYTSDAADERSSVDLGGRRIIKKKN